MAQAGTPDPPCPVHVPGELRVLDKFTGIDFLLHFLSGHKVIIWRRENGEKWREINILKIKFMVKMTAMGFWGRRH